MAKLTFVLEDGQEIVVPLAEHITLGRGEDNDVVVDDDRVSKRHAELVRNADGSIQLFDTNSTAGTFVNGERIRSHTITHGDKLAFGPLTAVLDLENEESTGGTTAPAPLGGDTQVLVFDSPVTADKIATRKKNRGGRKISAANSQTDLPSEELLARQQAEHLETTARLATEKARLQDELNTLQKELSEWRMQSEAEHATHHARMESLRAEEQRLAPIKTAVQDAESAHREWINSIQALSTKHEEQTTALQRLEAQHDQKAADFQHLVNDENAARHELEGLAAHREQALAHLQQMRAECAHDETALDELRRQIAEHEARSLQIKEVAEVRGDQLKAAEKKLDQLSQNRTRLESHIRELAGTEEKLLQALTQCREAETRHSALAAGIAALGLEQQSSEASIKDLESRIATLQDSHQQARTATKDAQDEIHRTEESLRHLQAEHAAHSQNLSACRSTLASETQRLEEIQTRRAELDRQCQELATTGQTLAEAQRKLADSEQKLEEIKTSIAAGETQLEEQKSCLKTLEGDENAAKGRLDVLHSREKDLRSELTQLAAAERSQRTRFEEVRQLSAEAESDHAARRQKQTSSIETTQRELADLVSRLTPLRDWKEAMDQLYARLAKLPQDSPEARDLWHEIEKEKSGLHELIATARIQAQAVEPGLSRNHPASHMASTDDGHRRNRAGGAFPSGSAQETTLRSRLTHLRESVHREESRLEQLRLERTRHESPHRSNPAAEAMMREQSRHLEAKIRQEQERHHALLRSLELSQAEEEKRRERLSDQERRLAELRIDITDAERQRSELRHQADLAQTELKNYEAAIDRVTKKSSDG